MAPNLTTLRRRLEAERREQALAQAERDPPMRRHDLADLQGALAAVLAVALEADEEEGPENLTRDSRKNFPAATPPAKAPASRTSGPAAGARGPSMPGDAT